MGGDKKIKALDAQIKPVDLRTEVERRRAGLDFVVSK